MNVSPKARHTRGNLFLSHFRLAICEIAHKLQRYGNIVGENWGGCLKNGENHQENVAKHSHMLQLFHGTFSQKTPLGLE